MTPVCVSQPGCAWRLRGGDQRFANRRHLEQWIESNELLRVIVDRRVPGPTFAGGQRVNGRLALMCRGFRQEDVMEIDPERAVDDKRRLLEDDFGRCRL